MNTRRRSSRFNSARLKQATPIPRPSQLIRNEVDKINKAILTDISKPGQYVTDSDSDKDRLEIDCDQMSVISISDSEDDDKVVQTNDQRDQSVRDWWTQNFSQKSGDPSKVVELTDEYESDEQLEVISPKVNQKSNTKPNRALKWDQMFEDLGKMETSAKANRISDLKTRIVFNRSNSDHQKTNYNHFLKCKKNWSELPTIETIVTKDEETAQKLFCIFCPQVFDICESAKSHYMNHLGLLLECGECHLKFTSVQSYRLHNSRHLNTKLLGFDEFLSAKLWSDHFVDHLLQKKQLIEDYCPTNRTFCPICLRIRQLFNNIEINCKQTEKSMKSSKTKIDDQFIYNHLHQHFQYFPYECIDCRLENKTNYFCLNRTARQHLADSHNIDNAFDLTLNQMNDYFHLKNPIKKLEKSIEFCLSLTTLMLDTWRKSRQKSNQSNNLANSRQ